MNEKQGLIKQIEDYKIREEKFMNEIEDLMKQVDDFKRREEKWLLEKQELTQLLENYQEYNRPITNQKEESIDELNKFVKNNDEKHLFEDKNHSVLQIKTFEESPSFTIEFPDKRVCAFDYSFDGKYFAIAGLSSKLLRVYDAKTHEIVHEGQYVEAESLQFSPDSKLLAVGGSGPAVYIIEVDTWKIVRAISSMANSITCLRFSPDGKLLSLGMNGGYVAIYTVEGQKLDQSAFHESREPVVFVHISADMKYFISSGYSGYPMLFSLKTYERVHVWKDFFVSCSFSPDSAYLVAGNSMGTIKIFDVESKELLREYKVHDGCINCVHFSHDGSLIYSGSSDNSFAVTVMKTGQVLQKVQVFTNVWSLAINGDETRLSFCCVDNYPNNVVISEFKVLDT
eukprot:TRINITY_DN3330_c4_g4_i1.p1 TRINITY_DN3330_c4_g4~~TRINITY_DN3330_c4_g4_i1.p1  ORF type:complete len:398 (+),score=70.13 TRINITY_DN3330_c4_g4_i1:85-1278(+)